MIYKLKDYDTSDSIEFESIVEGKVHITFQEYEGFIGSMEITKEQLFTLIGALHKIQKHTKNS